MGNTYMPGVAKKRCNRCGKVKDHKDFHKQRTRHSTFPKPWCKACCNQERKEYPPTTNPEYRKAAMRAEGKAKTRLKNANPELFDFFFREELAKEGFTP